MDWTLAIEKSREELKHVLAVLVALAGPPVLRACGDADIAAGHPTLPRHLFCAVLRLLRPPDSAARWPVIVAVRGLVVTLPRQRPQAEAEIGDPPQSPRRKSSISRPFVAPCIEGEIAARRRAGPRCGV